MNEDCVHHWVIEPWVYAESAGRCKKCSQTKVFDNTGQDKDSRAFSIAPQWTLQEQLAEAASKLD